MNQCLIMEILQSINYCVVATGDGDCGDSILLKKADIGIAMGIVGTEVAKEASDMIVIDDSLSSIINGIAYSKKIVKNLFKHIVVSVICGTVVKLVMFVLCLSLKYDLLSFMIVIMIVVEFVCNLCWWISLCCDVKRH